MTCKNYHDPITFLVNNTMPKPALQRHSTSCFGKSASDCSSRPSSCNNPMMDSSQAELSLSDLVLTKPKRTRSGDGSKMMEETSSRTATTVNESYNHSSSFGGSFSQRSSISRNIRNPRTAMSESSDYSRYSSSRGRRGETDFMTDGSMHDSSLCSLSSSTRSSSSPSPSSRLRNLNGIRRRRSDPVTRRWREQCSKLYKEHVLDSCPEQRAASAAATAATKIQACVRKVLLQKNNTKRVI